VIILLGIGPYTSVRVHQHTPSASPRTYGQPRDSRREHAALHTNAADISPAQAQRTPATPGHRAASTRRVRLGASRAARDRRADPPLCAAQRTSGSPAGRALPLPLAPLSAVGSHSICSRSSPALFIAAAAAGELDLSAAHASSRARCDGSAARQAGGEPRLDLSLSRPPATR